MKVKELIEALKLQDPEAPVYVDFDCEGGNEEEASYIVPLDRPWTKEGAIAIR